MPCRLVSVAGVSTGMAGDAVGCIKKQYWRSESSASIVGSGAGWSDGSSAINKNAPSGSFPIDWNGSVRRQFALNPPQASASRCRRALDIADQTFYNEFHD